MIQTADPAAVVSDADLVGAARAGDPDAFDVLFARHWARVVGVCARRVPPADAEDVAQEVFVRALRRLDTLDDPARFGAWVRTIAVRACADIGRSRSMETIGDLPEVVDPTSPLVDELIIGREDVQRLAGGLAALQPRDSQALWLRDALDTPVPQIARELGLTEASTRVLLARARKRLRAAMAAVAVWLTGIVGVRRQWLANLLPSGPSAPAMVAASLAVVAVSLVAPLSPEPPSTEVEPAVPSPTPIEVAPAATTTTAHDAVAPTPSPVEMATPTEEPPEAGDTAPTSDTPVSVERQPVDDPEPDHVAQIGDDGGDYLVDVYDGGVVGDLVREVVPGCLMNC